MGLDHWRFHLDDAASWNIDDDDDEMVIEVRVEPKVVPVPGSFLLVILGLGATRASLRRVF